MPGAGGQRQTGTSETTGQSQVDTGTNRSGVRVGIRGNVGTLTGGRRTGPSFQTSTSTSHIGPRSSETGYHRGAYGYERGGWDPAMSALEGGLPGYLSVLGRRRRFAPNPTLATGSPEYQDLLRQAILGGTKGGSMSPFLAGVVTPATERANLEASILGRSGSGEHSAHVARAIAPLYHAEHARLQDENLRRLGMGFEAGRLQTGLEQNRLTDLTNRHMFRENEGIAAVGREAGLLARLAGLGEGFQDTGRRDTSRTDHSGYTTTTEGSRYDSGREDSYAQTSENLAAELGLDLSSEDQTRLLTNRGRTETEGEVERNIPWWQLLLGGLGG